MMYKIFIIILSVLFINVLFVDTTFAQIKTENPFCADFYEPDTISGLCDNGQPPTTCRQGFTYAQSNKKCVSGVGNYPVDNGGVGAGAPTGNQTPNSSNNSSNGNLNCENQGLVEKNGLCVPPSRFGGLAGSGSFGDVASAIIRIFLTVAGVIAVVFIIIGGYQYIFSAGNAEASAKGKKTITSAIIGLVVVVLSFLIVTTITELLTSDNVTSTLGGYSGGGSGSGGGGTTQNPIPGD